MIGSILDKALPVATDERTVTAVISALGALFARWIVGKLRQNRKPKTKTGAR